MKRSITHSVNCQVCGAEVLNYQIRPGKIGSVLMDICNICQAKTEAWINYKEAILTLNELYTQGQLENNPENPQIKSPNVVIEPIQPAIQKAVQLLQRMDPNYFVGVSKIEVGASPQYGHVESGPGKDPSVININLQRIISEAGGNPNGRDVVIAAAITIAHEAKHSHSFDSEKGFVGGESVAEQEEQKVSNWIKANESRLKDLLG
jgi:hypothetical protein